MNNPEHRPGEEGREANVKAAEYQALLIEAQAEAAADTTKRKALERASKHETRQKDAYRAEVAKADTETFERHKRAAEQVEIYGRLQQLMNPRVVSKYPDDEARKNVVESIFDHQDIRVDAPDGNRVSLQAGPYEDGLMTPILTITQPPEGFDLSRVPMSTAFIPECKDTKMTLRQNEPFPARAGHNTNAAESGPGSRHDGFDLSLEERLDLLRQYFPVLAEAAQVDSVYNGPSADALYEESLETTLAKQREMGNPWGENSVY
jgi:hypothetical protein